jgi:hypothetical protein
VTSLDNDLVSKYWNPWNISGKVPVRLFFERNLGIAPFVSRESSVELQSLHISPGYGSYHRSQVFERNRYTPNEF